MAKSPIVGVRLPPEQHAQLHREAKTKGITPSDLIRQRLFPPVRAPRPSPTSPECARMVVEMANIIKQCRELLFEVPPPNWVDLQWQQEREAAIREWQAQLRARLPLLPASPKRG